MLLSATMVTWRQPGAGKDPAFGGLARRFGCLALVPLLLGAAAHAAQPTLRVEVFKGAYASVNSFILTNGRTAAVIDVQRKRSEARKLADAIKATGLPLSYMLISHGHTDHFTGMALLHREFPAARIVVASADIKRDIKEYAIYMDTGGATAGEPALDPELKPRSAANPDGFDYDQLIEVLPEPVLRLDGGGVLELTTDYPATEAPHMTTAYCRELNAVFLADLGYNRVHLWMGDDITLARIAAWRSVLLGLKEKYSTLHPTIYPGHGDPTDLTLFDNMVHYMDDYVRIVTHAHTADEAWRQMVALYPSYQQADFFLKYSVANHVR
jgi:glyoxylase-like metal-dependent hydrolase (beta-lactamase superfamily II)